MNELENYRAEITEIDAQMARLFEKRMSAVRGIAEYKKERGLSILDTERENRLIEKNRSNISDCEIEGYYVSFLKNAIEQSRKYQSKLINGRKVAYSGVEGAFAHIAAKKLIPEGEYVACKDFTTAYRGVENGEYDCAVLPIENSFAGEVGEVTDLLFSGSLYVNQVIELPVRHNLMAKKGARLSDVKTVVSHPQAISQCSQYIARRGFEIMNYSNTAAAAKLVKESGDAGIAAIASDETAEMFGLEIIEPDINDIRTNTTRFAVVSRQSDLPENRGTNENSIIFFTVQNRAGALAQTLNIIGAHGFNMKCLRSRPMKSLTWNYYFYVEIEGNLNSQNGRELLQELSALCERVKLAGTYSADNT